MVFVRKELRILPKRREDLAGKLTVLVEKMDDKDLEAAAVSSTKNNWAKYFKDRTCLYSGKVENLKAANELIHMSIAWRQSPHLLFGEQRGQTLV